MTFILVVAGSDFAVLPLVGTVIFSCDQREHRAKRLKTATRATEKVGGQDGDPDSDRMGRPTSSSMRLRDEPRLLAAVWHSHERATA